MPQVGDRVIVAGQKLGAPTREGTLLAKIGSMIRVRWSDGNESLFTPGAGSVEYQPQSKASAAKNSKPAAAKKQAGGAATSSKKAAPKAAAKKQSAKKQSAKKPKGR